MGVGEMGDEIQSVMETVDERKSLWQVSEKFIEYEKLSSLHNLGFRRHFNHLPMPQI